MENKASEILNKLLSEMPQELKNSLNKDLTLMVAQEDDDEDVCIDFVLGGTELEKQEIAWFGTIGGELDGGMINESCSFADKDRLYCNKADYAEHVDFNEWTVCPYTGLCDSIQKFIEQYRKSHNIKDE